MPKTEIATTYGYDRSLANRTGGMDLQELEYILSDIRMQPLWREEADKCGDYYDAHQLTYERIERMEKLGIPPLVTNLTAPVVNAVLGMEAKTRTDWRVIEADEASDYPEDVMTGLNVKLNEAERLSHADRAISDAYAAQIKAGVGWVYTGRSLDSMNYRYKVEYVHRNEIWWDMRAKPDLSDARYLIRKKRYDKDVLKRMMPKHADLIDWVMADRFKSWQFEVDNLITSPDLTYAANIERITNIEDQEWRDADRKRATLFEVWYRQYYRGDMLVYHSGKAIPFNKKNPFHRAIATSGEATIEDRVYSLPRVSFFLGCHRLYDFPTPYSHNQFPYTPFFGYREDNSPVYYGLIRNMISPQDIVNSADAKMHWMLNAKRIIAHSDAIDTRFNTWRQVQEQVSSPNAVILLDPSKPNAKFEVASEFQLNQQQFQRRQQAALDIEQAAGVYKARLGAEGSSTSGVMTESLIEQSNIMLAEINDNYSFSRRQVGEQLFHLVHNDLMGKQTSVAYKQNGKKKIIILNEMDESGESVVANDISNVDVRVTLEDIPSTPSFKSQQLTILSEVVKSIPPEMQALAVPAMIALTDIPDKEDLAESIRKMAGVKPKMSPEEEQAAELREQQQQQIADEINRRVTEANVKMLEEKVKKLESENRKIDAERIKQMVEAMYSAMQAGQVAAQIPQVTPVADAILESAGFKNDIENATSGQQQVMPSPQEQEAALQKQQMALQQQQQQQQQVGPATPGVGEAAGIETPQGDGVR